MWLLPSRCRPDNLQRFFEAYKATGGTTPGMVLIGPADLPVDLTDGVYPPLPIGWQYFIAKGDTQGEKIAEIWDQVVGCGWLGLIGDDCVPVTAGWDAQLVGELDGTNIVSCNDGWQAPQRLGNCWVMSGDVVRAVGYIFPPGLQHLYVDDVWEAIGAGAASWVCRMDVLVEHRHVLKREAQADDTHRLVYGSDTSDPRAGLWPGDGDAFRRWKYDRDRAIAAVKALAAARIADTKASDDEVQKQRLKHARTRKVMIATPVHDGFEEPFVSSIIPTVRLLDQLGIRHEERWQVRSSNLPKSRNVLAATFLASDCDDLLFIDSDMEWQPGDVVRLLASDKPVIGAVGRRKDDELVFCCRLKKPDGDSVQIRQDDMGAVEALRVGTGFLKISRSAFAAIVQCRPDLKSDGDDAVTDDIRPHYHRFFQFGPDDQGEDYFFCDLFREVGGEVWVDDTIELGHTGKKTWRARLRDVLEQGAAAPQRAA